MSTATARSWGTSAEVAEILGISTATVLKWSKRGTIRARVLPGAKTKFSLSDARRLAGDDAVADEPRDS